MTEEEVRKLVTGKILLFVGREDTEQVEVEMKNMLIDIVNENPEHFDFIFQVIKEGPKDVND